MATTITVGAEFPSVLPTVCNDLVNLPPREHYNLPLL